MNKQDEEKARKIADNCGSTTYNGFVRTNVYSKSDCVKAALEMSAWKEQQMIEKFTKFLETNSHIENNRYLCIDSNKDIRFVSEFIEYFKNYMTND